MYMFMSGTFRQTVENDENYDLEKNRFAVYIANGKKVKRAQGKVEKATPGMDRCNGSHAC
ncbi:MAG: hypothetical protein FD153_344 [Rhodospirillaceae bacterium]|nr:MAG: hypothetical protein FD153_344 [Rhodospirillaceae bacterium]